MPQGISDFMADIPPELNAVIRAVVDTMDEQMASKFFRALEKRIS